jgi:hypothetical protein
LATKTVALDWDLDTEDLEVNDDSKHSKSSDETHHVRKASQRARPLSFHVKRRWKREMIAPSNSGPRPVLIVVGKNTFQTIDSQILVAMKRKIP